MKQGLLDIKWIEHHPILLVLSLIPAFLGFAYALFFYLSVLRERKNRKKILEELETIKGELDRLKSAPQAWEFRIERFDVLWFATITTSPITKQVLQTSPGLPHCLECVKPLTPSRKDGQWVCLQCETKFAASLDDLSVVDTVNKLTLRYLQERHPEFRSPAGDSSGRK